MKKVLLVLALLGLVFAESNTNTIFGIWGSYNTPSDYPTCCTPQTVTSGCRTRCCRTPLIGRGRWSCCRTVNCCKPKKVCCPRYKCCKPRRGCCPAQVPTCETNSCVSVAPTTTCTEDWSSVQGYSAPATSCGNGTTCVEDYSSVANYSTSYGEPVEQSYQQQEVV